MAKSKKKPKDTNGASSEAASSPQRSSRKSAQSKSKNISSSASDDLDQGRLLINVEGLGLSTPARPFLVEYFPTPAQIYAEMHARQHELAFQRERALQALETVRQAWQGEKAIPVGRSGHQKVVFDVDLRTKFGHTISPLQYVILVDVPQKHPEDFLKGKKVFVFPPDVLGVPVKVRENHVVSCLAKGPAANPSPGGNVLGGLKISSDQNPTEFGTLGICVPTTTNGLVGVTNSHVVGESNVKLTIGQVVQPPGPVTQNSVIGKVEASTLGSFVDAAWFSSTNTNKVFQEGILGLNFNGLDCLFLENTTLNSNFFQLKVVKVGATTLSREGFIFNYSKPEISVDDLLEGASFFDVIEVRAATGDPLITDRGDSGSVLVCLPQVLRANPVVIGLNFAMANAGGSSYAIPFGQVIESLQLKIPEHRLVSILP